MASEFVTRFAREARLDDNERAMLDYIGVRTEEDVDSLVRGFPSLADVGLRLPVVSSAAAQAISGAYSNVVGRVAGAPPQASLGAQPPPGVPTSIRSAVGSPPPLPFAAPTVPSASIDLRLPVLPWPVRDQGSRGTCVAFGSTACVEHLQSATEGRNPDYSEQFLYWAIKEHSGDPNKTTDGTWLQFARDMLQAYGICHERDWGYVGTVVTPVSGQTATDPSNIAMSDAANHKFTATLYARRPTAPATTVLQSLEAGRVVAISLPVFQDPTNPNGPTNWTTPVGWAYGRILNPPMRSVVVGGHCVCVTGFEPDRYEPNGGYFIIRNSWGTAWANLAPRPGSTYSPEQGYGEISATYVDSYCWELLQL